MDTWLQDKTSAGKSRSITSQYYSGEIFNSFHVKIGYFAMMCSLDILFGHTVATLFIDSTVDI
jgi:hypothetical protein